MIEICRRKLARELKILLPFELQLLCVTLIPGARFSKVPKVVAPGEP